ncbi:hypothetical protein ACWCQK_37460 [Streptomyces sp. NPDC002306]
MSTAPAVPEILPDTGDSDAARSRRPARSPPAASTRRLALPLGSVLLFLVVWQSVAATGAWSETLVPPLAFAPS